MGGFATGSTARFVWGGLVSLIVVLASVGSCSDNSLQSGPRTLVVDAGGGGFGGSGGGGPPDPDAGGLCGNEIHQIITNAPNVYFVLDASGSMGTAVSGNTTRYERVRSAAVDLVKNLGPLINVGAAVFPKDPGDLDACHEGDEVLPVTPGDPYVEGQTEGPTTKSFRLSTNIDPFGGTPTGATLEALTPKLTALSGTTIVLLATDGGPNCNANASCSDAECIPYIEMQCSEGCCDVGGASGPEGCIDRNKTVMATAALAAQGIDVYIIGIAGSELYGEVLNEMAIAGGAPQFVSPFYYKVDNLDTLNEVLASIASVVISCEFELLDAPSEQGDTNVYLDKALVPYDVAGMDGWHWKSPTTVELVGEPCQRLKSGKVKQVQIVSGCPTEVPQ